MRPAVSSEQNEASTAGGEREALVGEKERLEERQHELNSSIGRAKKEGRDPAQLIEENRDVSRRIKEIEEALAEEEEDQSGRAEDTLTTDVLTTTEAFRDLRSEWTDLMSRANVYSPFMMWEWLYPWWKYYGQNKQLRLITVRDGSHRLVGLAPMMLGFTENGRCDRRILAFVGSGEEGPRGQYFTLIVEPELQQRVLSAVLSCLQEMRSDWQIMKLWRVRQDSLYHALLDALTQHGDLATIVSRRGSAVHGPLPETMTEFIDAVPNRRRRTYLRHQAHRLGRTYESVRHQLCTSQEALPEFIERVHQLNIRRHRRESSWIREDKCLCLRETADLLFAIDSLRVELLLINGSPAAGLIGLVRNNTYFAFEPGYDPAFAQDHAGHVLYGMCIQDCIKAGIRHYDWLSAHDYGYEYFSGETTVVELAVFRCVGSSLRYAGSRLWWRGTKEAVKRTVRWPAIRRLLRGAG